MKRLLAKAEQQIRKLQEKVADQKQQIRELQAQAKHEDSLAAEREELKAEIADLKGEIRELTRANHEQVEKLEALRAENAKLKAGAKVRKPNGMSCWGRPPGITTALAVLMIGEAGWSIASPDVAPG